MTPLLLRLGLAAGLSAVAGAAGASPFQTMRHCAEPSCSQYVLVEAENFTSHSGAGTPSGGSAPPGWVPQAWAHESNLFSSDVSNVFMNRRAFLHADANATVGSTASASIAIPAAGNYTVLLRCLLRGVHF